MNATAKLQKFTLSQKVQQSTHNTSPISGRALSSRRLALAAQFLVLSSKTLTAFSGGQKNILRDDYETKKCSSTQIYMYIFIKLMAFLHSCCWGSHFQHLPWGCMEAAACSSIVPHSHVPQHSHDRTSLKLAGAALWTYKKCIGQSKDSGQKACWS